MKPEEPYERAMAVLCTCPHDYTRLMQTDEKETFKCLTLCKEIISRSIASHRGRMAIETVDELLAEFLGVEEAVAAAVTIQESLAILNKQTTNEWRIFFSIGIDYGSVIVQEGYTFGSAVNIAKGIQSAADSGEIVISSSAFARVRENHDQKYLRLGGLQIRGIVGPVDVYLLLKGTKKL